MTTTINLLAPEVRADPYPHYAELRRSSPVCQVDPFGFWAVTRYDDVAHVLKDTDVFSSAGLAVAVQHADLERNPIGNSLLLMDPPDHTKLRALVSRAFGASVIPRIEPLLRASAAEGAELLRGGDVVDFCEAVSVPLPSSAIANLLGLDPALRPRFQHWSDDLVSIHPAAPPEVIKSVQETVGSLERYLETVISARQKQPKEDLVSDLLAAELDGAALTHDELVSFLFLLVVAGLETTSHLLTNAVRVLVRHHDVHDRVRSDPSLIPAFIEEVLRFDPPVQTTLRLTTAKTQIAGVTIPAGSIVAALLGSANRDEQRFDHPDVFDIDRPRQAGLPFGHGIHFCLGAALARAEARIALEALVALPGYFEEAPGEQVWNMSPNIRGLRRYPVRLAPAAG